MNLAPESLIVLETFSVRPDELAKGLWDLIGGKIRVLLKGWGSSSGVNVRAGVAIAGIRGTDFILAYNSALQQVDLLVHEGKVEFSTPKAKQMVQTGQSITATGEDIGLAQRLYQDAWEQDVAAIGEGLPSTAPAEPRRNRQRRAAPKHPAARRRRRQPSPIRLLTIRCMSSSGISRNCRGNPRRAPRLSRTAPHQAPKATRPAAGPASRSRTSMPTSPRRSASPRPRGRSSQM